MQLFAEKLQKEILNGLPGTAVQWEMASSDRIVKGFPVKRKEDTVEGAVLILLYPVGNKIYTVLIQRPVYDGVHSGQISFPGGKREKADRNLIQTSLREAHEETGIKTEFINIIGILTPLYIPVSNIEVTPVLAWSETKPYFVPEKKEVAYLIEAELALFQNNEIIKTIPAEFKGESVTIKCYDYNNNIIWGATAMIIHELMAVLKRGNIDIAV